MSQDERATHGDVKRSRRAAVSFALGAAICAATVMSSTEARAQAQTFYLDRLFMAGAPDDSTALWRPVMHERTRFYGQFGLGFGLNPFRVQHYNLEDAAVIAQLNQSYGNPVTAQMIGYLDAGVHLFNRVGLQVQLPIALLQLGNDSGGLVDAGDLKPVAPMDMRLDARAVVFRSDSNNFKLGLMGAIMIPTGNWTSYDSDGYVGGHVGLSAEYALKSFFIVFNTGFQFRDEGALENFRTGNEWRWGLGAFLPLRDGAVRLGAQIFGSTGITGDTAFTGSNTPVEWQAEGRFATDQKRRGYVGIAGGTRLSSGYAPDFRIVATAGYWFTIEDSKPTSPNKRFKVDYSKEDVDTDKDGLIDSIDLCPTEPEDHKPPNTDDGCPAPPDRDGDGIPDSKDKCPDEPEDFDKVDDQDGCPEDDADKDNIGDAKDACPKEPGQPSPDPKRNGCPQFIQRSESEIRILKQVQFATGKSTILSNSYPILDEVVKLLNVNPEIKHLGIEGHTDNRGSDDLNEKLSADRANAVMQYLINKGIDAGRLSSEGFGPRKPIADNNTADGRQKNRRVEFHIRDKGVGGGVVNE